MSTTTGPTVGIEHWTYQAQSPLRDPAEIRELASSPARSDLMDAGEDYVDELDFSSYDEDEGADETDDTYEDEYLDETPPATGSRTMIPSDGLRWRGPRAEGTPEVLEFMRNVYLAHVARSVNLGKSFVDTLPAGDLARVSMGKRARKDAAAAANAMFRAANDALLAEGKQHQIKLGVRSGYRSADEQFLIWQGAPTRGFPIYYQQTKAARRRLPGGEFGTEAAQFLAEYIGESVAAPGFSNHQNGLALDLSTDPNGEGFKRLYRKSWFHNWLKLNAPHHRFHQRLPKEPWHWEYLPPKPASEAEWSEVAWAGETPPTPIAAGCKNIPKLRLLSGHRRKGGAPDVVLGWNAMPSVPKEIDVVVHLHGYSRPEKFPVEHYVKYSGLDLKPVGGATGAGRSRPTLTVLPRGDHTGVKPKDSLYYIYTFPALITKNGLDELVRASLKEFADQFRGSPPKVARLILTAHSGGAKPLMLILRQRRQAPPDEVFVFDGLYQDATAIAEWARPRIQADRKATPGASLGALRVFYGCGTKRNSVSLRNALAADLAGAPASVRSRYRVEYSDLEHMEIPRRYGWRVLAHPAANVPDALVQSGTSASPPGVQLEAEDLADEWEEEWEDEWESDQLVDVQPAQREYEEPEQEWEDEWESDQLVDVQPAQREYEESEQEWEQLDEDEQEDEQEDEHGAGEIDEDESDEDESYEDESYEDEASVGWASPGETVGSLAEVPQALMTELAWRGEFQEAVSTTVGAAVQAGTGQGVATQTRIEVSVRTDFGVRSGNTLNFDWAHGEAVPSARITVVGTAITAVTNAHGRARLDTAGLADGIHTVRIEHTVANQSTTHLAGPSVADPLISPTSTLPSRIYRRLDLWVTTNGGRITGAMVAWFASHGGVGNRDRHQFDATHLPVDWKPVWMRSPMKHSEVRRATTAIDLVVVHTTGGLVIGPAINTFLGTADVQNAHYLIDHNGHVIKFAEDARRANQTGYARWKNSTTLNGRSIGIEVMQKSNGYTTLAMAALTALVERLRAAYPTIPAHRIVGHCDIATSKGNRTLLNSRRLNDPGARFDWATLERRGLGMQVPASVAVGTAYGGIFNVAAGQPAMVLRSGDHDPHGTTPARLGGVNRPGLASTPIADIQRDLEHIGYSVRKVGGALGTYDAHTIAAVDRFQRHFFSGIRAAMRPTLGRIDATTAGHINAIRPGIP